MSNVIDIEALDIHTIRTHNVTTVEVNWSHPKYGDVYAAGSAQRHPTDRDDQHVGYALALSRALTVLARKIERQANARSEQNLKTLQARKARKARKAHPTQKAVTVAVVAAVDSAVPATVEIDRKKAKRDLKVLRGKS